MKLRISPAAARRAALPAAAVHAFCSLALQAPAPGGAAWLSALAGTLLALPVLILGLRLWKSPGPGKLLCAALAALSLARAAGTTGWICASGAFLALDAVHPMLLAAPACLAMLWCVSRGGDALGGSATVAMKLSPALLIPILLLQLPCLRAAWLFPILGDGSRAVLIHAPKTAAALLGAYLPALALSGREEPSRCGAWLGGMLAAGLIASAALLLQRMMAPALTGSAAALAQNRLDALLTNGRAPLSLQLPMLSLWFSGLICALAFDGFCAAALLQRLAPRLDGMLCGAAAALVPFVGIAARGLGIARATPILDALSALAILGTILAAMLPGRTPRRRA